MSSKKNKFQNTYEEYIAKIKKLSTREDFDPDKIINNSFFTSHIAKGSEKYKLYTLNNILDNKEIAKNDQQYNENEITEINNRFKNPKYLTVINYNSFKLFKYFGIENIEQLCEHFNINLEQLKLKHNQYIDMLKFIPFTIQEIRIFINLPENHKIFVKEMAMPLNINNFCIAVDMKGKEIELNKQLEILLLQERLEKESKLAQEKEKEWKVKLAAFKKQALTLADLYPLLNNPYVVAIINKKSTKACTIETLAKYFKLSIDLLEYESQKTKLLTEYCSGKNRSIHNMNIEQILHITPTELKHWKVIGRLVPTETREFRKWGKTLESDYFTVDYLALITPADIAQWRMKDQLMKKQIKQSKKITENKLSMKNNKTIANEKTITSKKEVVQPVMLSNNDIAKMIKLIKSAQTQGFIYKNDKWYKFTTLNIEGYPIKQLIEIKLKNEVETYLSNEEQLLSELTIANIDIVKEENKLSTKIENYDLTIEVKTKLLKHLSEYTNKISEVDFNPNTVDKTIEAHLAVFLQIRQKQKIITDLKIEQYETGYPLARQLNRNIKIIVGPTNSGKTYEALQHLMKASSGAYLAPLRLLAMEIYDKLNASGVPCNLITGEERIIVPGAMHTSSTIEMMNENKEIEVAIIDEFQMLDDSQRGWAWTSAMVGVPAKTVYVIGNEQKLNTSIKLYEHLGETCEVIKKERFNKLNFIDQLVDISHLRKGDALIAFSRKDILSYATLLREKKYKVSIIYGALSPEVRRKQADLFNSGQTDIVISTDAIGMGLNLPIKRIIFATISKYDGQSVRQLQTSELLQIAGRAGRYGLHEEGFVGLLSNKVNDTHAMNVLKTKLKGVVGDSYQKIQIAPTEWHINIISETLKTKDLGKILLYFTSLRYNSIYETANLEQMVLLYSHIKYIVKDIPLNEQAHLITAPVELHNEDLVEYYVEIVSDIVKGQPIRFVTDNYYDLESAELENKKLTIYAWLSFYYNNLDTYNINDERNLLSSFIQKRLRQENNYGFSRMIEPKQHYNDY